MSEDEPLNFKATLVTSAIVAVGSICLTALSSKVLLGLAAWTLASIPIGMLIGHCASYGRRRDPQGAEPKQTVSNARARRILWRT